MKYSVTLLSRWRENHKISSYRFRLTVKEKKTYSLRTLEIVFQNVPYCVESSHFGRVDAF